MIKQYATKLSANTVCNTTVVEHITLEGSKVERYCDYMTVEDVIYMPPNGVWSEVWKDVHDTVAVLS